MTKGAYLRWAGTGIILLLASIFFFHRMQHHWAGFAWDYAINWTAANGIRSGLSLYDREGLRSLGLALAGPKMAYTFLDTFNSYVGPPATALLLLPFTIWIFPESVVIYRFTVLIVFAIAVFLAGLSLPVRDRYRGWLLGGIAVLMFDAVVVSARLGQVDAWIMLSLATSIWAASRNRWWLAGIGVGIAALLKVSPGIAILYCLLRKKPQVPVAAGLTAIASLLAAAVAGRFSDLWLFVLKVLPAVSLSSLGIENQSLTGWFARIILPETDLLKYWIPIGPFRLISLPLTIALVAGVWTITHRLELQPLEIGVLVLIGLLIGPVTWDFYTAWGIVFLVQTANSELWIGLLKFERLGFIALLVAGGLFLSLPTTILPAQYSLEYFSPEMIAAHWALRLATGVKALGVLAWFGAGLGLLMTHARQRATKPVAVLA